MVNADLNCKAVNVVTYNMHGYKQGAAMLSFDVLLCQEHWYFFRKSVCNYIQCLIKSDRMVAVKVDNCIFVCVFPSF